METVTSSYMPKPNFFIVGAPKCGTTSLYKYLRQHPEVFMPDRKEPHFFSTDIERPNRITEHEYFELFHPGRDRLRIGEASADYFYSRIACNRIRQMFPKAKIVIALRNPVDKIHSAHAYRIWLGREQIEDFEEALARDKKDNEGLRYRTYIESGIYSNHVRMYFDAFGPTQVHVIIFEEMVRDPESTFKELCRFLDIRTDARVNFERHNASRKARMGKLSLLFVPSSRAQRLGRSLPRVLQPMLGTVATAVRKWNTRFEERPRMDIALRQSLEREFTEDVRELSALLGKDLLGYWFPSDKREAAPRLL